jgi:glycosyltransferase involved in cell wall biosynthesis
MKLLECVNTTDPAYGGAGESTRQRCRALQSLGHHVETLTLDDHESQWIRDWPGPVHALGRGCGRCGYNPRLGPWIRRTASKFDAIIVNGIWRHLGWGVRQGLRSLAVPYFVVPHSMLNPWFQRSLSISSISKVAIWRLVEWKVLRDALAVLFTCEEERKLASTTYAPYVCKDDVATLVGTSVPASSEAAEAEAFLSRFPHLRGKRLILYLGRLHPMKGCDLLIKAFSAVCGENPDLNLVIAGPDDVGFGHALRSLAKQFGGDRITWTGPLYKEMKWAALRSAALFALPSHCEAFPVALLEALGSGAPVLITDRVNIWNYVSTAGAGFVDTDTVEGTVRSLHKWLNLSKSQIDCMRTRAVRCFSDNFEAKSNAARFAAELERHIRRAASTTSSTVTSLSKRDPALG